MTEKLPPLLRGLRRAYFPLIAADVPWPYKVRSKKGTGRSAENHYKTMPLAEIMALPVGQYGTPNGRLLFWVTGPHLAIGSHIPIMKAWGYDPCAIWGVWIKPTMAAYQGGLFFRMDDEALKMNLGHTTRQNAEYVVEGRRGKPPERLSKKVRQVFLEPAREHSRKPEKFYRNAEEYAHGPKLELFGRTPRPGWVVRGDEADKFK